MSMAIYIPSKGRSDRQHTINNLGLIPFTTPVRVVVYPDEERDYRLALPKHIEVWACQCHKGIAHKRDWITNIAKEEKIVMLDDDLIFYKRGPKRDPTSSTPFSLYGCDDHDLSQLFIKVDQMLNSYAHVSVSMREGANRFGDEPEENVRYARFLGYRRSIVQKLKFSDVRLREDFHINLALLKFGYPSTTITQWAQGQTEGTNAPGGCSTFRTVQMQHDEAIALQALHPEFVQVVEKVVKGAQGALGTTFTDVKIAWKKAYQQGVALHGRRRILPTMRISK